MTVETPRMTATKTKVSDAVDAGQSAAESVLADAARRAEEIVRDSVETLRAQTRAYADTAVDRIENAQRVVVDHVKEKPMQSAVTALGIGVVIGLLLARRH